jgi:hypothetical protein
MGYVACIIKMRNACKSLVSNLKGIDNLKDSGTDERILKLFLRNRFESFLSIFPFFLQCYANRHFIFYHKDARYG